MRVLSILISLLLISPCLSAEPAVITLPQQENLVRSKSEVVISQGLVKVSAGVKVVGNATSLSITPYPYPNTVDFNLTLNSVPLEYEIRNSSIKPLVNFTDGDEITIDYYLDLDIGTHLIVIDFISNEGIHRIESGIRVDKEWVPVITNQSEWIQGSARVGKRVAWISFVQALNPNPYNVEAQVSASLLPNASDIKVVINGVSTSLASNSWLDNFSDLESKEYKVSILTPSVIEQSQELTILNSSNNLALIRNNLTLKNNALTDYSNVSLDFDVEPNNVMSVDCQDCSWRVINDMIRITLPVVNAHSLTSILIDYVDIPPLLEVTPSLFNTNSSIELSLLLIPERIINGLNLEIEVLAPDQAVVYADIISEEQVIPDQPLNKSLSFNLTNLPQGNYSVIVKAREGMRLIASDSEWFIVSPNYSIITVIFLISFISLLALVFTVTVIQKTIKY